MTRLTIIQARMGSERLPGKTLARIGDKTALEWVVHQLRRCDEPLGSIVVATSYLLADEPILREAERLHIGWFRWHPTDVLERFAKCHQECGGDVVVRITADCPFLDPSLLARVVRTISRRGYDYVGVTGAAAGRHQEAFTGEALQAAHRWAKSQHDREHVVPWIIRHGDVAYIQAALYSAAQPVELNTPEDLERLRKMVA